eukprot:794976-Rhodomonas_salina.4
MTRTQHLACGNMGAPPVKPGRGRIIIKDVVTVCGRSRACGFQVEGPRVSPSARKPERVEGAGCRPGEWFNAMAHLSGTRIDAEGAGRSCDFDANT